MIGVVHYCATKYLRWRKISANRGRNAQQNDRIGRPSVGFGFHAVQPPRHTKFTRYSLQSDLDVCLQYWLGHTEDYFTGFLKEGHDTSTPLPFLGVRRRYRNHQLTYTYFVISDHGYGSLARDTHGCRTPCSNRFDTMPPSFGDKQIFIGF